MNYKAQAGFLLGQLAHDPPGAFVEALKRMLDDQRERPNKLATTDADIEAAAHAAFAQSAAGQWEIQYPVFLLGFKSAFALYVGSQ